MLQHLLYHLELKICLQLVNWLDFGIVSSFLRHHYESVRGSGWELMEPAITAIKDLATRHNHHSWNCYGCRQWQNVDCTCWNVVAYWQRSYGQTPQAFRIHGNPAVDFVSEFSSIIKFDDRYCLVDVRCVVAIVIFKHEKTVLEIWPPIQDESLIREVLRSDRTFISVYFRECTMKYFLFFV